MIVDTSFLEQTFDSTRFSYESLREPFWESFPARTWRKRLAVFWRPTMTTPYSRWKRILLVDSDLERIEYLENLLYWRGYLAITVRSVEEMKKRLQSEPSLIPSYLPFKSEEVAVSGTPILAVVPEESQEVPDQGKDDQSSPSVVYFCRVQ